MRKLFTKKILSLIIVAFSICCFSCIGNVANSATSRDSSSQIDTNFLSLAVDVINNSPGKGLLRSKADTIAIKKAVNYLVKAKSRDSLNSKYCHILMKYYLRLNKGNLALNEINEVIKIEPNNVEAITGKGLILENNGCYKRALLCYKEALGKYKMKQPSFSVDLNQIIVMKLLDESTDAIKELDILQSKYPDKNLSTFYILLDKFERNKLIKSLYK